MVQEGVVASTPPAHEVLRLRPCLEHELARSVEHARDDKPSAPVTPCWDHHCSPSSFSPPKLVQILIQAIEALLPEAAILVHPIGDLLSGPASNRQGRDCATRPREIRPARSSTLRCLETAGRVISKGSANSLTDASPRSEARQDRAPGRIRKGRKRAVEGVRLHLHKPSGYQCTGKIRHLKVGVNRCFQVPAFTTTAAIRLGRLRKGWHYVVPRGRDRED